MRGGRGTECPAHETRCGLSGILDRANRSPIQLWRPARRAGRHQAVPAGPPSLSGDSAPPMAPAGLCL